MVYIPQPSHAGTQPSYLEAYNKILSSHRRSPLSSASSVIVLVAPNVDALCASRMLATLFKQDDIAYRIIPVCGPNDIDEQKELLRNNPDLHTLIMINMGNQYDLPAPEWFGEFDLKVTVHVIDASRPRGLSNLFLGGDNGERIIIWDDGEVLNMDAEKKSWEVIQYEPEPSSDDESDDEEDEEDGDGDKEDDDGDEDANSIIGSPGKRRRNDQNGSRKRRRKDDVPSRISPEEYAEHARRIEKYYTTGSSQGQSASSAIYALATLLERVDNEFLWLAILGITYQYITFRISRDIYEQYHASYYDEVSRINHRLDNNDDTHFLLSVNPDDMSVRTSDELRFTLFRHWTLYDAMFHSSYVASKMGIWKEKGRQRLTGMLAKMGFSIPQARQPFSHMDLDLKKFLVKKLNELAPEYGLTELGYPSFMRCYGFHMQPVSAADAVEGISVLLDVAGGMRIEVEIEGMRNGGEWFGSGRLWDGTHPEKAENLKVQISHPADGHTNQETGEGIEGQDLQEPPWWVKNFWTAYDALSDIQALKKSLSLSMTIHRAIVRQGTSIIDKQGIKTVRSHRVVVLSQGPDLNLFCKPGMLLRLGHWLVDALRDRLKGTSVGGSHKKGLPFVIACLDETKGTYTVVGVIASLNYDQIRKNQFAFTFLQASQKCNAEVQYGSFDTSILEIGEKDLAVFLEALTEQ